MSPVILLGTDDPEGHSCADRVMSLMAKKKNETLGCYLRCIKSVKEEKLMLWFCWDILLHKFTTFIEKLYFHSEWF